MLVLRYSTAFICAVFFIIGAVSGEDKAVGSSVSFRPPKIVPPVSSIIWKHKSSSGPVVKAIEWDKEDPVVSIPNPRFKDITSLDEKTGEITITKLTVEHSGVYTIDINSKEQEQRFTLNVKERVPKPKITIEKSINADVVYLKCVYNGTIIWKNSTGLTVEDKKNEITVKNTGNPENFYTCTLKNTVSEETSDPVYERELFVTGSNAGLIVGILFALLFVTPFIFVVLYLFVRPVHKGVNSTCPRMANLLSPLDCFKTTGNTEEVDKTSPGSDVATEPLKSTSP